MSDRDNTVDAAYALLMAAILLRDMTGAMPRQAFVSMPDDIRDRMLSTIYQDAFDRLPRDVRYEARRLVMDDSGRDRSTADRYGACAMTDLVTWLREQLDEDEEAAKRVRQPYRLYACDHGHVEEPVLNDETGEYQQWADGEDRLPNHHNTWSLVYDPARVLAEVAAKRAILELHDGEHDCRELKTGVYPHDWPSAAPWGSAGEAWRHASSEHFEGPCPTLRLLAQPYADRPGFREEWRMQHPA